MSKRAITNEQKQKITERLLKAWTTGDLQNLRLGQLIVVASPNDPFFIEDEELIEKIEKLAQTASTNG